MTTTCDAKGRPYLKLSEARDGMFVWLDDGFTCHVPGRVQIHDLGDGPYFECDCGQHKLDGQCDDGVHCIGVYGSAQP